ncbi:hypothetical protein Naga_100581g2 [Nannochloropsis gaditana]|uniref:Uncharacterized protein n=1 Tax=Nannochloropsis gaditana TaxID=72520 RepID=W7T932_9STRA|nr:hypothetical protein Naga_100581g2 [Nannochloropsis gaditana]
MDHVILKCQWVQEGPWLFLFFKKIVVSVECVTMRCAISSLCVRGIFSCSLALFYRVYRGDVKCGLKITFPCIK